MFERKVDGRLLKIISLDTYIIAVASINEIVGDWTAYIGVIIESAEKEWKIVWKHGTKLDKHIADAMFHNISEKYYYRC